MLAPPGLASAPAVLPLDEVKPTGIDRFERSRIIDALLNGKTQIIVLVASRLGKNADVAEAIIGQGGEVQVRVDEVGYLRARIPLASLQALRILPEVVRVQIETGTPTGGVPFSAWGEGIDRGEAEKRANADETKIRRPIPTEAARPLNPYMAITAIGAAQFMQAHPTADGRGVSIGILEAGMIDQQNPFLTSALSLAGERLPKIRGVVDPATRWALPQIEPDLLWSHVAANVKLREQVTGKRVTANESRNLSIGGAMYRASARGEYWAGMFKADTSLTGNALAPLYGVIWNSEHAWVDTNLNRDFSDEQPLTDVNKAFSTAALQPTRESRIPKPIPFVVTFGESGRHLYLYMGITQHPTVIAGLAAGESVDGRPAMSAAPSALVKMVTVIAQDSSTIEGFLMAMQDPAVDLVSASWGSSAGFPGNGQSIKPIILKRAARFYDKVIFQAASNDGPNLQTVGNAIGGGDGVIVVGAAMARDSARAHFGLRIDDEVGVVETSSRGPQPDGDSGPDLIAPPHSFTANPCTAVPVELPSPYVYDFPPCYAIGDVTSGATPTVAGAAAQLLSLARQRGLTVDATKLAWAMTAAARYLPNLTTNDQGNGLVDVARSWELLNISIDLPRITVAAPVRTVLSEYLPTPAVGPGLYEREGWRAGQKGRRSIALNRLEGGRSRYELRWLGNDGTFSTPTRQVVIPENISIEVPIDIHPSSMGAHSAFLELIDPEQRLPVRRIPVTVIAAESLSLQMRPKLSWNIDTRDNAPSHHFFVNVPAGVTALRLELEGSTDTGWVTFHDGTNRYHERVYIANKDISFPNLTVPGSRRQVRYFQFPAPGVWQVSVGAGADRYSSRFNRENQPVRLRLSMQVLGSSSEAATVRTTDGSRRFLETDVSFGASPAIQPIDVSPGVASLRLSVSDLRDSTAKVDLYLYRLTEGEWSLWDVRRNIDAHSAVIVHEPEPGRWKAVLDVANAGAATRVRLTEVQTWPSKSVGVVDKIKGYEPVRIFDAVILNPFAVGTPVLLSTTVTN